MDRRSSKRFASMGMPMCILHCVILLAIGAQDGMRRKGDNLQGFFEIHDWNSEQAFCAGICALSKVPGVVILAIGSHHHLLVAPVKFLC